MAHYDIIPSVDPTREFIEIADDFSNPLDIVREAISNSFDAKAKNIQIEFDVIQEYGVDALIIKLIDDGKGMDKEELKAFFDLGNSTKRGNKETIGEKGHGTKVYFNSDKIKVITKDKQKIYNAVIEQPYKKLFNGEIPIVSVEEFENTDNITGTEIIINGYNKNERSRFTQDELKDYILWFTKYGSIENRFREGVNCTLKLKGLDADKLEELEFGHFFPEDSKSVDKLFEEYTVSAPDYYCKKIKKEGFLKKYPDIKYQAYFSIEGNKIKQNYNQMLRRQGKLRKSGDYTVQERYGLWLCKDFIPIERKNEWITYKGSEYTKFHAFINCQSLKLTANRGSVNNTPAEILLEIRNTVIEIYEEIIKSDDWINISWLEEEVEAFKSKELERKDYEYRIKKVNRSNIAEYKNLRIIEPERESGVYTIVIQLMLLEPNLFPFQIIDYDTHQGIDVLVISKSGNTIMNSKPFYVEFKHTLGTIIFNHSFQNTHSIVCWDTTLKHDEEIKDLNDERRTMKINKPDEYKNYTSYFLDRPTDIRRIEVFRLKDYLKEKLGINFKPRTIEDTIKI